jgi:large subunit ribosomal protein L3
MSGLIGEKIGMTQVYDAEGNFVPVTVVKVTPNVVVSVKTKDRDGYNAVQVGFGEAKASRKNKPLMGQFKKSGVAPQKLLQEFRTDRAAEYKVGKALLASSLIIGDIVKVQATSKGKGFQGVMKRWHFKGGRDSHGCSLSHRVPGSIGQRTSPGRVFLNKKLPGHMGDRAITTLNLPIIGIEAEQNLILIGGCIPGPNHARVTITPRIIKAFEDRALAGMA